MEKLRKIAEHKHFTKEQLKKFRKAFNLFDADGDGKITLWELGKVFRTLGRKVSETELQNIMRDLDLDGNGFINFDEFTELMSRRYNHSHETSEEEIRQAFKVFDKDGDGTISVKELQYAMMTMGEKLTEDEIKEMVSLVDADGNGLLDYNEFVHMMMNFTGSNTDLATEDYNSRNKAHRK